MRYWFAKKLGILMIFVMIIVYIYNVVHIINDKEALTQSIISEVTKADIVSKLKEGTVGVVVDAGHGGMDPGKVGINNVLEKDINLEIALLLKEKLFNSGINVIMTRENDDGLYSENDSNKKISDLKKRVEIVNQSDAVLFVSIHQNSYTSESVTGAQVFYYSNSELSREVAQMVQSNMVAKLHDSNIRVEKENSSYYILKKTQKPAIIVECGFLSNYDEAQKLCDKKYQEQVADAINEGVIQWFNSIVIDKDAPVMGICDSRR